GPAPASPGFSQIKVVMDLGINQSNIGAVRKAVQETIPPDVLSSMANDLVAARKLYASGYVGTPAAVASLERQFAGYAPTLAAQLGLKAALARQPDVDPIDAWSLVHFLSGALLGAICLDFATTLMLLILWEIIEPKIWPGWHESPINQVTD